MNTLLSNERWRFPVEEAELRRRKVREKLALVAPEATGLLVFSRVAIYYLTGTMACGLYWLPPEGEGVLLVRKGRKKALAESPLQHIASYKSYREVPALLAEHGAPIGGTVAAEMSGLPWDMANMLQSRLKELHFVSGDQALRLARAVKTERELTLLREGGRRHARALTELLPAAIHAGMTEWEIARSCMDIMLGLGHGGIMRMSAAGEELFFGHVAADDSGNAPDYYNGPMGFRGLHPALPILGGQTVWRKESPLTVDIGFCHLGYVTDKTQCYWAGRPETLPEQARIAFDLCREIQNHAVDMMRPGVTPSEVWAYALDRVKHTPFVDGFMGLGENAVPFLGHSIGLTMDEQPVIARGFNDPLEAGMVLAVEPKIGIPGFGMMGTEDSYEITAEGCKALTSKLPEAEIIFLD